MNGFKNIEITNFRGINNLKIDDFSCVNVFLEQKGSGKSSILEAILMLTGMSNPGLPQSINMLSSRGAGYQSYKYTYEGLSGACENDVKIRGIIS